MEAISEQRKGRQYKFTDSPIFVPKQLRIFGTLLNDYSDDEQRQNLLPFISRLATFPADTPDFLPSVENLCRDYLVYRVLPQWMSLIDVGSVRSMSVEALRAVLDEIDDLEETIAGSALPPIAEYERSAKLVRATVRPVAETIADRYYSEGCLLLTICRSAAQLVWRRGGEYPTRVEQVHTGLMIDAVKLFDVAIKEYEK
jgi:hypothetical protein